MHLQTSDAHKETWAAKLFLLVMISQHVTDVLTKKTLNALSKLLYPIDIALIHLPFDVQARAERWNPAVDAIVPGHVRYQISDNRKTLHWLHNDWFIQGQVVEAGFAREPRPAIDFRRT